VGVVLTRGKMCSILWRSTLVRLRRDEVLGRIRLPFSGPTNPAFRREELACSTPQKARVWWTLRRKKKIKTTLCRLARAELVMSPKTLRVPGRKRKVISLAIRYKSCRAEEQGKIHISTKTKDCILDKALCYEGKIGDSH